MRLVTTNMQLKDLGKQSQKNKEQVKKIRITYNWLLHPSFILALKAKPIIANKQTVIVHSCLNKKFRYDLVVVTPHKHRFCIITSKK